MNQLGRRHHQLHNKFTVNAKFAGKRSFKRASVMEESWFLNHPKVRNYIVTVCVSVRGSPCRLQLLEMQSYGLGNNSQLLAASLTYLDLTEGVCLL